MKKSTVLRQERQTQIEAQTAIVDGAKDDKGVSRSLNTDETVKFKAAQTRIEELKGEIEMSENFEDNQRTAASAAGAPIVDGEAKEHKKIKARYSLHKAIRSQLPNGQLDGVEREIHQETVKRATEAGVSINGVAIPSPSEIRADGATVTQDGGAFGANLVAEDLQSPIDFLRPKPVLESVGARMITNLRGDIAFPTNDGGIIASWEGEVSTVAASKNAYGKKTMKPNRLAVTAPISLQNILQASIDLERLTVSDINKAVAQKIDESGINGPGTGNIPLGLLNVAGTNLIVAGTDGSAPTWNQIIDLETGVYTANADAATMAYIINTGTKGKLKKTKHSAGDLNYLMSKDNTINGYRVGVSNLVPNNLTKGSGVNLNAGIFGDFSQFLIGQWGFYDMVVDNITRKKEGYIEITLNTFLDMLARQASAFSVIKDWDIS